MKRLVILLVLVATVAIAPAQTLQQYLGLRKQHKVTAPAGVAALETHLGSKVLEVRGVVKGSFRVGDRTAILLERADGGTIVVDAEQVPDWLMGNETPARLLIHAYRENEASALRAILISVATEAEMSSWERQEEQKRKAAADAAAKKQAASRSSAGLNGPIGRGTSRNTGKAAKEWVLPASEVTPIYASFIKKQNPKLSNTEALRIAQGIVGFSLHYDVDARLIMAMVMCESGFDPGATSRVGAMGLGQLMPGTAQWMNVSDPYDSVDNLYGTVKLVRKHLDDYKAKTGGKDFEALVLSLAAYNAGAGAVKKHGGVPPYKETQNYVRKVIATYYKLAGIS